MARPKRVFTEEQIQKIEEYALNNCHIDTIALALDIPKTTLERRFGAKIRRIRAQGRVRLRQYQCNLARTSADMAKFLGKNELGQTDKQIVSTITDIPEQTEAEKAASIEAARVFKLKMAKGA